MSLAYVFSLVFFVAFAVYFILGIYILSLNTNSKLNRLFFVACLALAVWAFCFSIANSAQDYETALLWRRWTSLGWGTVYSLLLHACLLLTERHRILRTKWIYVLIYLPAAINVWAFGYSDLAREQYKLVHTAAGWVNVSANSWSDVCFNIYYVAVTVVGLLLLWNWGRNSKDKVKTTQAYLFLSSYGTAMVLGTVTDKILNTYPSLQTPQMAPVFVLIPTTAILYAIKRYGLMGPGKSEKAAPGKILSESNMERFITIMSFTYILGGMLNFAAQYFFVQQAPGLHSLLLTSLFFMAIGILLTMIKFIPVQADIKEFIFMSVMLVSLLLLAVNFIDSAGITVWAAPIIVVMLSVVFNRRLMISWIGTAILLTQIYIWVRVPEAAVRIDGSDYLARIGIMIIVLWLAYCVNRVYIQRLEENEGQIRFQQMVSRISGAFVKVTESDLDDTINELLALCGEHFQVDRTFFMRITEDPQIYEWCNEGVLSAADIIPKVNGDELPWWMDEIMHTDLVTLTDVDIMVPEACTEKDTLNSLAMKQLISITVRNKDAILGVLFFTSAKAAGHLGANQQELLRILANLLSDALVKVEAEREISYLAYYDALTGLPNHTLFKQQLEQTIGLIRGTGKQMGVLFIDLDAFKIVNDTIGHLGGDEMLKQVTSRISACLGEGDMVSRFGGDEFLIKLTGIEQAEDISKVAEDILLSVARPIIVKGQEFFITASAGIAVYPEDGDRTDELIRNADLAMYAAKEKGKNQYAVCSPAMKEEMLTTTQLTNSLYRAVERNELELYYQPQVSVLTKEIVGLEALVRWKHPELGMISPATFIPLAEQTGLIIPIGQWVLETACRQMKEWQALGLPQVRMAVNLSVMQFQDRNLLTMIGRTLRDTELEPEYLELEITESSTAADGEDYIVHVLHDLKELGVSISIDDFGSGYSSLSRLKTLPVDRIKIDMQFVRGISAGNDDEAIAKTIIQLAKNLKLHVIAEGVETEAQFDFFDQYKCDEIQGYYFYKPMPAPEIETALLSASA
ncbi:EAL domain-containing protein [Paenibacillus sp. MMS20-IR301]|uniref:EAL domain-containing protein n=1 Tax=Paenibacillus sp. MMS20-IR301 TaxID=2895946 RepID=UPI0028EF9AB3|nr:EAL domain-containing protein [Paenibacillus sp. MMS20-IR301]WNS41503.1 EAL domain-containing protein [Paenibacillus sp. MMS20-IR301]